jgi:hypothetical protein
MLRAKLLLVCVPVVLLLAAAAARADTVIGFESPTYGAGTLTKQDDWAGGTDFSVINTDASSGLQSVHAAASSGYPSIDRTLNDTYAIADTFYVSCDVKRGASVIAPNAWDTGNRLCEFGFDTTWAGGFYVYGGAPGQSTFDGGSTTLPNSDRWVTIWGKFYDAGSGNKKADLGWCELNQTPFVDGQLVTFDCIDKVTTVIGLGTSGGATGAFDNLRVSNSPAPEPSAFALLALGATSLLAYAWRKRKLG